jgi:UDP-glucose 4-epimerase
MMKILVTGGAGYIGGTICSACIDAGMQPIILDNLSTGCREFTVGRTFYEGDIANHALVDRIFREHPDITVVIHCAGLVVVPDSVADPVRYYKENVAKTLDFVEALVRNGCERLIFSSSASLYATDNTLTVDEHSPLDPASPYARTKAVIEWMLADVARAHDLRVISLRYFNPIGADPTMRTGPQNPNPSHVLGRLNQAHRKCETFFVTGVDWPTQDGSGIRDYVHVWDLARAHIEAVRRFDAVAPVSGPRYDVINIGTGTGTTVRELVDEFDGVVGEATRISETGRRHGDNAGAYTVTSKAAQLLGWTAQFSVTDGIRHSLEWERRRQLTFNDSKIST